MHRPRSSAIGSTCACGRTAGPGGRRAGSVRPHSPSRVLKGSPYSRAGRSGHGARAPTGGRDGSRPRREQLMATLGLAVLRVFHLDPRRPAEDEPVRRARWLRHDALEIILDNGSKESAFGHRASRDASADSEAQGVIATLTDDVRQCTRARRAPAPGPRRPGRPRRRGTRSRGCWPPARRRDRRQRRRA